MVPVFATSTATQELEQRYSMMNSKRSQVEQLLVN
jgi:hypothetical protein